MNKIESLAVTYLQDEGHVIIPINAAIKIFTFLTRDCIENCKLVCRGWKQLVDFADKQLPKRSIDALILSSNHEYTITIYYSHFKRVFCHRKYFYDRDIDEIEYKNASKMQNEFNVKTFRFPCGEVLPCVSDNMNFTAPDPVHHLFCRKNERFNIFHRGGHYTRKLFTPPLGFYERLKKMLHNGYVKRLVFQSFTFTDLFVEKFFEYLNGPFNNLDAVYIHSCSFRHIRSGYFHNLLNFLISKEYFIERSTNCLPEHVSKQLLDKRSIKMAEVFYFGSAFARHHQLRDDLFLIDDEAFLHFANSLSVYPNISRNFFGIAQCRITPEFARRYGKIVEEAQQNHLFANTHLSNYKNSIWLFKYVIFKNLIYKLDF